MSSVRNPRKLYVSNVSRDARERDVGRLFTECGRISRIQFKQNFCFVEFEHAHAAEDAIRKLNGIDFMGRRLVVELYVYRGGDPRYRPSVLSGRDRYGSSNGGGGGGGGSGYRLVVTGLEAMTSWQDLKDFGRTAGKSVSFADVYTRRGNKEGIIEYHDYEDYKHAIRYLDEARLNGVRVRVYDEQKNKERDMERDRDRDRDRGRERGARYRSKSRSRSRDRGRKYGSVSKSKSRSRSRGSRSRSGSVSGKRMKEEDKRQRQRKKGDRSRSRSPSRTSRERSRSRSESGGDGGDDASVKSEDNSRSPQ